MSFHITETVGYIGDTKNEYVVLCKVGYGWATKYEITPKSNFGPGGVKDVSLNQIVDATELYSGRHEFYTRDNYVKK